MPLRLIYFNNKEMRKVSSCYTFEDFPVDEETTFPMRVRSVSLYNAEGYVIGLRSVPFDKDMKLIVNPRRNNEARKNGYVGYYEDKKDETIVVLMPGEYFEVK